jgi:hypothetical protein
MENALHNQQTSIESPICLSSSSTSTSTSYNYSPRSNQDLLNSLSYPREITIASTPIKTSSSALKHNQNAVPTKLKQSSDIKKNYHVNHAYNFVNEDFAHKISSHLVRQQQQQHHQKSKHNLPQSIEKPMVHNFQNMKQISSVSYQIDMNDFNNLSKITDTDSTSLQSTTSEHSLRDEDAWLPILSIAEEEVIKKKKLTFYLLNFDL